MSIQEQHHLPEGDVIPDFRHAMLHFKGELSDVC